MSHLTVGGKSIGSLYSGDPIGLLNGYDKSRFLDNLPDGPELVDSIPLESNLDLLNYISFNKGCYIGQELVARTKFKVPFLFTCR